MTARTRCVLAKHRKCVDLLCGWRFPLLLKGSIYRGYVR